MDNEITLHKVQTICLMVLATAVLGYAIYWLRPVLVPFVIAVFVVSGISPILDFLQRELNVYRLVAAGITFLLGLLMMLILGMSLWASTMEMVKSAPTYRLEFRQLTERLRDSLPDELGILKGEPNSPAVVSVKAENVENREQEQTRNKLTFDALLRQGISVLTSTLFELTSTSVIVLIYVFFLLLGASQREQLTPTWKEIDRQIREYIRLKTVISVVTGLIFGLALHLAGVPMAVTFGVLAFLLNYIPNIGPLIATLLPIPLIVLHPEAGWFWMTTTIVVISLIQFLSGNVIEPQMMGDSTDLHPIVVLLALMFWGMMWGLVGMFLATPITAGIKLMLEKFSVTRPIADFLAGRGVLQERNSDGTTTSPA